MATIVNKENYNLNQRLPILTEKSFKRVKNAKPKMDHAKAAAKLQKEFRTKGIEFRRVK